MSAPIDVQLRRYTEFFDGELPNLDLDAVVVERVGTASMPAIRPRTNRARPWLIAGAAAVVSLVLFGGLLLLSRNNADAPPVVDQIEPEQSSVVDPAEPGEPEASDGETPWSIEDLPQGSEWGTLATPGGAVSWVRLSADQVTLPASGEVIPWPSGLAVFDDFQLWVSDDGIEWRIQPLPLDPGQEAKLTFDDGVYWLIASDGQWSPATSGFWRSTDGVTWDVIDPQGLLPPGPTGFFWTEDLGHTPPVTAGELTLSYAFYEWHVPLNDYLPVLIDDYDPDRDEGCGELSKRAPGVFAIVGQRGDQACPYQLALRFEETETGLRVFDNATGDELGEILGADPSHIDRLAQEGDAVVEERLLIIQDNKITPIENPLPGRFPPMFGVEDTIYAYVTPFGNRTQVNVWRTSDGRNWTDLGPPNFPQGTPQTEYMRFTSFADSVVVTLSRETGIQSCASGGLRCLEVVGALETTDGINWSPDPGLEGRPDQIYPILLESGWFANDGPKGDDSEGGWWIGAGNTWVSLADLGIEGPILTTGAEDTTFFFGESSMWILRLDPTG